MVATNTTLENKMQYRTDKKSNTELSALGLGCMRLPRRGAGFDIKASEKLIMQAIESGVNFFDSAYLYPGSEAVLGEVLHKNNVRDKVYISTKIPHSQCKQYEDFDKFFNIQKDRLKTDYFDYYLIHNIADVKEWERVVALGIKDWIAEKRKSGEIKRIGFSFHGSQKSFFALLEMYDWDFCMIQYNYMNEYYQAGVAGLRKAHEKGLPVIIMEPLLGGKLTKGLPKKAQRLIADTDNSRKPAEWAIMWLLNQPEVTMVLSGMSNLEMLDENVKTASKWTAGSVGDDDLAVIESLKSIVGESYHIKCTGCNYCTPCPYNVNIPDSFLSYNLSYSLGYFEGIKSYIMSTNAFRTSENQLASKCTKCGVCILSNCPQDVDILKELDNVKKRFEPFWVRLMLKIARKIKF